MQASPPALYPSAEPGLRLLTLEFVSSFREKLFLTEKTSPPALSRQRVPRQRVPQQCEAEGTKEGTKEVAHMTLVPSSPQAPLWLSPSPDRPSASRRKLGLGRMALSCLKLSCSLLRKLRTFYKLFLS